MGTGSDALSRRALLGGGAALALGTGLAGGLAGGAAAQPARSIRPPARPDRAPDRAPDPGGGPKGALAYGWDADVAGPEAADLHVAPDGDDAAPGTREAPLRTVQAGVDRLAARGRGSLALHPGLYREAVTLDALRGTPDAPFRIHRLGPGRVTLTAAEPLGGWTPLPAADAARLGLPEGRVWRTALPFAALPGGEALGLHLFEADEWCPLATWRADASDPARTGDPRTFWEAAGTRLDAEGHVLGVEDPRLAALEPGALAGAELLLWHSPNLVTRTPVAGVEGGGTHLVPSKRDLRAQMRRDVPVTRYALQNLAAGMAPGHWMLDPAAAAAPGRAAILLWPRDPANLAARIEYAARETCIDFGGARHVELFGLETVRASGPGLHAGSCIRRKRQEGRSEGIRIRQCRAAGAHSSGSRGYGAIALSGCDDVVLERVTVEEGRNSFGLFLDDCRDADLRALHVRDVSQSPARFFTLRGGVLAFSLFEDSGWDAHANQFNFYEGSDDILVYGVRTRRVGGYVTYQEASRIAFAFCDIEADPESSGRALVSQNRRPGARQGGADGSGEPVQGGTFLYWNNCLQPARPGAVRPNSLMLGPGGSSQRHAIFNNLLHGGGVGDVYLKGADPALERRSHNRYSGTAYWQEPRRGWRLGEGESLGGPAGLSRQKGRDMRDVIAALAPRFPRFDGWDRDVDGRPVDWRDPPVGCHA